MGGGVLVVVVAFWMLALSPRRHEASSLKSQIAEQRSTLAQLATQAAATPAGQQAQSSDAAQLAQLGEAVPSDDQTASLMYQLQDAAGRSHVTFNSIEPSGANGAPAGNATAAAPA